MAHVMWNERRGHKNKHSKSMHWNIHTTAYATVARPTMHIRWIRGSWSTRLSDNVRRLCLRDPKLTLPLGCSCEDDKSAHVLRTSRCVMNGHLWRDWANDFLSFAMWRVTNSQCGQQACSPTPGLSVGRFSSPRQPLKCWVEIMPTNLRPFA